MPLINCKLKLKLKQTNYFVVGADGTKNVINDNNNDNSITFTFKDTRLYAPVVTFSL